MGSRGAAVGGGGLWGARGRDWIGGRDRQSSKEIPNRHSKVFGGPVLGSGVPRSPHECTGDAGRPGWAASHALATARSPRPARGLRGEGALSECGRRWLDTGSGVPECRWDVQGKWGVPGRGRGAQPPPARAGAAPRAAAGARAPPGAAREPGSNLGGRQVRYTGRAGRARTESGPGLGPARAAPAGRDTSRAGNIAQILPA